MDQFLHSESWMRFQAACGQKSVKLSDGAHGFIHTLPLVGKYLYTPRWPSAGIESGDLRALLRTAGESGCGWVRVEPATEETIAGWRQESLSRIVPAPHDMQPRENLVIDISKTEEVLLSEMKPKTRYNIRLAEKKSVKVLVTREKRYREIFLRLIEATAKRQGIIPHGRYRYEKYFDAFSEDSLSLFVALYSGHVLAANLVVFCGDTATYLHGGTSDEYRETMAPALLQWEQIKEAKRRGCRWYDFGGVRTMRTAGSGKQTENAWAGITRFKTGFAPETETVLSPGCYDIIIDARRYQWYDRLRRFQQGLALFRKFIRAL